MARPIEMQLSEELRGCRLAFIGNEPILLADIYNSVKNQFPNLCDDNFKCSHYGRISQQAEWQHTVRNVLNGLKKKGLAQQTGNPSEWIILPPV